jgi:hypothetical protein
MELNTNCCQKLVEELIAWKEKVDQSAGGLDNMASCDKAKLLPQVIELHMFIEDIGERIDRVKRNCQEALERSEGVIEVRAHKTGNWGRDWEDALLGKIRV